MTFAYFRNHQDKPYTIKDGKNDGNKVGERKEKSGGKVAKKVEK